VDGGDTKGANRGKAQELRQRVATNELFEKSRKQYERMLDVITKPENKIRADYRAPFVYEDAEFISASRPSAGIHEGYFGRAAWNNEWTANKTIFQAAELAEDLSASTGGRGTLHIFRGIENYTIDATGLLGADYGETALLGKHKPIAGLSGYKKELRAPGFHLDYLDKEGIAPRVSRAVEDIDLAFTEKVLKEDVEKIKAGLIPERELYGLTLAERNPAVGQSGGPSLEDIRARFKGSSGLEATEPSQAGLEFLEKEKIRVEAENKAIKIENDLARPATREAIEKEGYLYHFAPNRYAENIAEKGLASNKDPRAAQGPGKIFYWTDPSRANTGAFAPDIGDNGGLNLYRTKVTPEMLDSFQMDPKINLRKDGIARSVFFEADSFPAEKIGIGEVDESTGKIRIKYDSLENVKQGLKVGQKTSLQTEFKANKIVRRPNAVPVISRSEAGIEVSEFLNSAGRARATMDLLRAGSETSAAVTKGKRGAGALRNAALAANILRNRFG